MSDRGDRYDRGDRGDRGDRSDRRYGGARGPRRPRRRICQFCVDKTDYVDYKDIDTLRRFVSDRGKILPRRGTGTCAHHQRILAAAIKRAREIALLPFVAG